MHGYGALVEPGVPILNLKPLSGTCVDFPKKLKLSSLMRALCTVGGGNGL